MKNFLMNIWQEETGTETAEWVVIAALILAVASAVYTNTLQGGLTTLAGTITTYVSGIPVP
jgi:Flp pilus assembly pilin Flp